VGAAGVLKRHVPFELTGCAHWHLTTEGEEEKGEGVREREQGGEKMRRKYFRDISNIGGTTRRRQTRTVTVLVQVRLRGKPYRRVD